MDAVTAGKTLGLISDVQRFSLHDGPGIRTSVFLKGCLLRCFWCHNPETWRMTPELRHRSAKCVSCAVCAEEFPGLVKSNTDGGILFEPSKCADIRRAAALCPHGALDITGKWVTAEEMVRELLKDADFYAKSGGGVTVTGGEPLLQPEFCRSLLALCKQSNLHTAMETSGYAGQETVAALIPFLDLVIFDIKTMDNEVHKRVTGVSNEGILENAIALSNAGISILVRTPIVPGVNDDANSIADIYGFIKKLNTVIGHELMPFHKLASVKYASLGLEDRTGSLEPVTKERIDELKRYTLKSGNRL